jgi:hypothetical protein
MPQNMQVATFVLGAVFVLLAISAGGFKIFGVEMSGVSGRWARYVAGAAGVVLIIFALLPSLLDRSSSGTTSASQPTPSPGGPPTEATQTAGPAHAGGVSASREDGTNDQGRDADNSKGPAATAEIAAPPTGALMGSLEIGTNRDGSDFDKFGRPAATAEACAEMCRVHDDCRAMTYVLSQTTCWLKKAVPNATSNSDMISSVKVRDGN